MPIFLPGSTHTAHVSFTYLPAGQAGTLTFWLATADGNNNPVTQYLAPVNKAFTSTGGLQTVDFPGIVMPTAAAGLVLTAFADVFIGSLLVYPLYSPDRIGLATASGGAITWD